MKQRTSKRVNKTASWRIRITPEDKQAIYAVIPEDELEFGGASEFWRTLDVHIAKQLAKLRDGDISMSEFSDSMEVVAEEYLEKVSKDESKAD